VISLDELKTIWIRRARMTLQQARDVWTTWRKGPLLAANHAAVVDDLWLAKKLVEDLGALGSRVYYKRYNGVLHVIFKGYAGTRKILNATRYLATNPKVVQMGVGKAGAVSRVRGGMVLTLVLVSAFRIVDYVMRDEATLAGLIGQLASDVIKVGASAGCAAVIASIAAGVSVISCFAVGPLLVAIAVGFGVGTALDYLDSRHQVTERIVEGMDSAVERTRHAISQRIDRLDQSVARAARETLDDIVEAAIREAQEVVLRYLRGFTWVSVARG